MLNQKSRKNVYFSFIHSYQNYGNIAWGSTYKTKLKKIFTYQKKAARVIFFTDRLAYVKPLMLDTNALNVYQINIYQNFILLYKSHTGTATLMFFNRFSKINHNNTTSSKNSGNYTVLKPTMKLTIFLISRRSPILWNIVLDATLKESSKNSSNYTILKSTMILTNFSISRRYPILWNTVLDATLKEIESLLPFKAKVKEMLLARDNELSFF